MSAFDPPYPLRILSLSFSLSWSGHSLGYIIIYCIALSLLIFYAGKLQIEMQKVDINLGSPLLTFPFWGILKRQTNSPSFPFKKLFRRLPSLSAWAFNGSLSWWSSWFWEDGLWVKTQFSIPCFPLPLLFLFVHLMLHLKDSELGFFDLCSVFNLWVVFRCQHYRRRCKIRAPCCNEIYPCRHCHNEATVCSCCRLMFLTFVVCSCLCISFSVVDALECDDQTLWSSWTRPFRR